MKQEAQLPLREQGVMIMLLSGIWLFQFNYTLRVGFWQSVHGKGRTRVYTNSTHSSIGFHRAMVASFRKPDSLLSYSEHFCR